MHRRGVLLAGLAALSVRPAAAAAPPRPASPSDPDLLDALTWGASESALAQLRALGRPAWLAAQFHPAAETPLPPEAAAAVATIEAARPPPFDLVATFDARARDAGQIADPDQRAAAQKADQEAMTGIARGAMAASLLRALYAPDQLRARLTWFWLNHFNVYLWKSNLRLLVGDYEATLRPRALGRFRDLLMATLRHPAMQRTLDNADNAAGRINENYAREIMELHTLGVGAGYTQQDVQELARILTGAGIDAHPENPRLPPGQQPFLVRDGLFLFNPARHDWGPKTFLGRTIPASGFAEIEQAVDLLAAHPATAQHVSTRLATYFVADTPPPALVERMARAFSASGGEIAAVLEAMIGAPEFATAATRFKDPMRWVLSAIRAAYDGRVVCNTAPLQGWLGRLGEGLFNHLTPDGYPLDSAAWDASGQMATRFEVARQIGSGPAGLFHGPEGDRPAFPLLQNRMFFEEIAPTLSPATRAALDQAVSPQEWNTLYLSSPEFMR